MSSPRTPCGPHVELVKTEGVRIARCPCGTLHITFARNGVTMQFAPEHFAEIAQAMSLAKTIVEAPSPQTERIVTEPNPTSGFVTIVSPIFKKPSN